MLKPVQLGRSGLRVSRLALGTMNFGEPGRGHQGDWTLGIDDARPIFIAAIERGLFTFDCADIYGLGASEHVVGKILRELLPREDYVLATKISMPLGKGANSGRVVAQARDRGGRRVPTPAGARLRGPAGDPSPSPRHPRSGGGA